jgi:hypothetical protein
MTGTAESAYNSAVTCSKRSKPVAETAIPPPLARFRQGGVSSPQDGWLMILTAPVAQPPSRRLGSDRPPPATVYEALITAKGLSGWWTRGGVSIDTGETIHFTFHGDFGPQMRPTGLEPGRLVQWACVDGHTNWQDNTFTFGLEPRNNENVGGVGGLTKISVEQV